MENKQSQNVYFANLGEDAIGSEVMSRVNSYVTYCKRSGVADQWQDLWIKYHAHQDGFMNRGIKVKGDNGELSKVIVNQLRNIIQQILVMTTSNRPAINARAINSDSVSLAQAMLAENIVNYYLKEKKIESKLLSAGEQALVLGSGYTYINWSKFIGKEIDVIPGTQDIAYDGDLEAFNPSVWDVYFDPSKKSWDENEWVVVRRWVNKFELAKKHPQFADEILNEKSNTEIGTLDNLSATAQSQLQNNFEYNVDVEVFMFFHKKSLICPFGKRAIILKSGKCLELDNLESEEIPVYQINPSNFLDSQLGYAVSFDLQGLQEAYDATYSSMLTNVLAHGVQNIQVPIGTEVESNDLMGGGSIFRVMPNSGEVKGVNLLNIPQELLGFLNVTEKALETISGVNSVARGNIEASQRSGAALALVQSMAIQFNSGFQNSYARLIESVGTAIIRLIKLNAESPRVIAIAGEDQRSYLKEFSKDDIAKVDRVMADVGNAKMNTVEGKAEMADKMAERGLIKTSEEYITVYTTGQLKPLYRGEQAKLNLIHKENDMLLNGQIPKVAPTQDHRLHLLEHQAVMDDPEVLNNPELSGMIWEHMQEHMIQWTQMSNEMPDMLNALGIPPLMPRGPVPPTAPNQNQPQMDENGNLQAPPPVPQAEDVVNMPKNPLTGQPNPTNNGE